MSCHSGWPSRNRRKYTRTVCQQHTAAGGHVTHNATRRATGAPEHQHRRTDPSTPDPHPLVRSARCGSAQSQTATSPHHLSAPSPQCSRGCGCAAAAGCQGTARQCHPRRHQPPHHPTPPRQHPGPASPAGCRAVLGAAWGGWVGVWGVRRVLQVLCGAAVCLSGAPFLPFPCATAAPPLLHRPSLCLSLAPCPLPPSASFIAHPPPVLLSLFSGLTPNLHLICSCAPWQARGCTCVLTFVCTLFSCLHVTASWGCSSRGK